MPAAPAARSTEPVLDRLARLAGGAAGARAAVLVELDVLGAHVAGRWGDVDGLAATVVSLGGDEVDAAAVAAAGAVPVEHPDDGELLGALVLDGARKRTGEERRRLDDVAAIAACELRWRRSGAEQARSRKAHEALLASERAARAAAEAAEKRYAFLAEVSALLDASLDYHDTFRQLARLAVPALADYCLIDEVEPDGGTRRIARAHVDPEREKLLYTDVHHPPEEDPDRHPVLRVIRSGQPVLVPEVTDQVLDGLAHDAEHRRRLSAVGLRSFIIAPLLARGRLLGIITLGASDSGRHYGAADLAHAEEVARRAAVAIDNARLYGQAQAAVRAREAVLEVVSHDMRNPLASILLNATMVLDLATPGSVEGWMTDNLRQVVDAVEQTNRLIADLLDVARLEQDGGMMLDRTRVDARSLVQGAVRLLRPIAAARGLELADEPGPSLPVYADSDRVVQVLSNLIGNAIKFTDAGGAITVRAETVEGEQRFSVSDTGVGIPAEHQPRVFDRFWQVGRADRRGVGLGLPIARGIVEAHGGRIWVQSEPGAGTTVCFTLPSAADPAAGGPRGEPAG